MTRILLLFLSFISILTFAQKYHFDYETTYKSVRSKKNPIETLIIQRFINSKNSNYEMTINKILLNHIEVSIFDDANSVQHYFNVYKKDFPFTSKDFVYNYSVYHPNLKNQIEKEKKSRFFKVGEPLKQDISTIYNVEECKTEKLTKCFNKTEIQLISFKDNITNTGLISLFDIFRADQKIKFDQNYILKSGQRESTSDYYGKHKLDVTLESINELDLEIIVDQNKLVIRNL